MSLSSKCVASFLPYAKTKLHIYLTVTSNNVETLYMYISFPNIYAETNIISNLFQTNKTTALNGFNFW